MINHSILKYTFIIFIIILLLLGFFYLFSLNLREKPYEVLTPDVYEVGTTVSLYQNTPPGFPKDLILEEKTLDYSGTVTVPSGKKQTTVSYISNKSMTELVDIYSNALPEKGWQIMAKSVYPKVSVIQAVKKDQSILLSIAPSKDGEVMITFQYEQ